MTREELFRAVGEVRGDQIEAAWKVKKMKTPWRKFGALAACLILVVTVVTAAPWIEEQIQWKAIIYNFNPNAPTADSGGGAEDMDGCYYWRENPDQPLRPNYSTNVEIGELAGVRDGAAQGYLSLDTKWLSEEELFAQDTAIFRGTVREMQYYQVEPDAVETPLYYTKAMIEVTDPIRGNLETGEVVSILWLGAQSYMTTSLSGPLDDIREGSDAIFMSIATDRNTGWREGGSYFCYADLADYYLSEGIRYVFLDTGEGVQFEQSTYSELPEDAALDDAAAYVRKVIGGAEQTQPAAEPVMPQTESSGAARTEGAAGPSGAREASSRELAE